MYSKFKFLLTFIFLIIISLSILNGCDESDPVIPPSEHFEPEGWLIRDATQKPLLVVWQGVIQKSWNSLAVDTFFSAPLNALSDHLTVKFLDANKNIINPPSDADHHFGWAISDTSILSVIQDSPTDWAFHLKGKQIGSTNIELQLRHVGHVDVRTPQIPVIVEVDTSVHGEPAGLRLSYEATTQLIATATDTNAIGTIIVNDDSTTEHILVEYFDEQGHFFQPEYPLHQLMSVIGDTSKVDIITDSNEPWVIQVKGKEAGSTTIEFKLIVSSSSQFDSYPIIISIIP